MELDKKLTTEILGNGINHPHMSVGEWLFRSEEIHLVRATVDERRKGDIVPAPVRRIMEGMPHSVPLARWQNYLLEALEKEFGPEYLSVSIKPLVAEDVRDPRMDPHSGDNVYFWGRIYTVHVDGLACAVRLSAHKNRDITFDTLQKYQEYARLRCTGWLRHEVIVGTDSRAAIA